jgi:glycosyltransferase involved in cell wall biosynthesis
MNTEPRAVAVIVDGTRLRAHQVPGHELDVIGGEPSVDRRLLAVADALSERHYDLIHVSAPGPAAIAALLIANEIGLPVIGSYHTEPRRAPGEQRLGAVLSAFYGSCRVVLSPGAVADAELERLAVAPTRIARWEPGVDRERFHPASYSPELLPDAFNVLYTGPLSREHGIELLVEAFLTARDRDPRLHLVLAGVGPEQQRLRAKLGAAATLLGWPEDDQLARAYATADLFVFPSAADAFGQSILEAQASGLPVLAVHGSASSQLIEHGRNGCLVAAEVGSLADAIRGLARRGAIRDRLATGGLLAVRERSRERSLAQLAEGYARATVTLTEVARAA